MASLGFMIFGCGLKIMAGTTVSKAIAMVRRKGDGTRHGPSKEMAIARLGVFAVMWLSPMISNHFDKSVVAPVAFCTALLVVGLLCYTIFVYMDRNSTASSSPPENSRSRNPPMKSSMSRTSVSLPQQDVSGSSPSCACYTTRPSSLPQRYAPNFLRGHPPGRRRKPLRNSSAASRSPAMILTRPFLGAMLDYRGKGATMLMAGAIIVIAAT